MAKTKQPKQTKVDTNKVLNFSIFLTVVIILLMILAFVIYLINIPAPNTKATPEPTNETAPAEQTSFNYIIRQL